MSHDEQMEELHEAIAYELLPLLRAAELLADHQRIHSAFDFTASASKSIDDALTTACPTWRNPITDGDELAEMLRVIRIVCEHISEKAGEFVLQNDCDRIEKAGGKA